MRLKNLKNDKVAIPIIITFCVLFLRIVKHDPSIQSDSFNSIIESAEWTLLNPLNPPVHRRGHCMGYDSWNDKVIMFGGFSHAEPRAKFSDTWSFDFSSNSWTEMFPGVHPPNKELTRLVFDENRGKFILFGGHTTWSNIFHNDTWSYDYYTNTWTNLNPTVHPDARWHHGMVYMSKHDRFLLFGGHSDDHGFFNDTWLYDPETNTWEEITTPIKPWPRTVNSRLVYDLHDDVVVLYGGSDGTSHYSDVWYFDPQNNTWNKIVDFAPPIPTLEAGYMIYDIGSRKVILYQRYENEMETWTFDFPSKTWTLLNTQSPTFRSSADVVYDSNNDQMIIFGGDKGNLNFTNETWAFKLSPIEVDIDIKPGSYPNSINLGSNGNVPIAIFSTEDFDATNVDPTTVSLAGASVKLKGKGTPQASAEDVNGDGLLDLIVHVDTTALELSAGDSEAVLEGETYDGQKIRGVDTVRIVNE